MIVQMCRTYMVSVTIFGIYISVEPADLNDSEDDTDEDEDDFEQDGEVYLPESSRDTATQAQRGLFSRRKSLRIQPNEDDPDFMRYVQSKLPH